MYNLWVWYLLVLNLLFWCQYVCINNCTIIENQLLIYIYLYKYINIILFWTEESTFHPLRGKKLRSFCPRTRWIPARDRIFWPTVKGKKDCWLNFNLWYKLNMLFKKIKIKLFLKFYILKITKYRISKHLYVYPKTKIWNDLSLSFGNFNLSIYWCNFLLNFRIVY